MEFLQQPVQFGRAGLWLLLSITAVISFMLATEMAFYPAIAAFRDKRDGEFVGY